MSTEKKFKKGEKLFAEGDQPSTFYILQSGKVSLFVERGGQKTEIDQPAVGNMLAEQGVFGFPKQTFNAEALSEVKVIEFPIEPLKMVFDKSPNPYKLFVKALGDEIRRLRGIIRSNRMEQDNTACPNRYLPRLCSILNLVAKTVGTHPKEDPTVPAYKREEEKKLNPKFQDTDYILSFHTLKIYTGRMFLESVQRMQSFCELLSKLGYVTLKYEKNEETEAMELQELRIHNIDFIEAFGEFYQHNFFKAGKSEVIVFDKSAHQIAMAFNTLAQEMIPDRQGAVTFDYKKMLEDLKSKFFIDLKETHVALMEKKGLYLKRQNSGENISISFNKHDWLMTYKFWQVIQEVDRWNALGHVNMTEDNNAVKQPTPSKCPQCATDTQPTAKFCMNCGCALTAAA